MSTHPNNAEWRTLYEAAILETDRNKISQLIFEAEHAIMDRIEDLNRSGDSSAERGELLRALRLLRILRGEANDELPPAR